MVHIKDEIATLRIFSEGESYEGRDTALFSCTAHFISDSTVYLCNARGVMSVFLARQIREFFLARGITQVEYERREKYVVRTT